MTDDDHERRRYRRMDLDMAVQIVLVDRRQLVRKDLDMANIGLGGCLLRGALPPGERVAVLVHRGLFVVGRVMPGSDAESSRIEWAPDAADADELIAVFGLPED